MAPLRDLTKMGSRLIGYDGRADDPVPAGGGFLASVALVLRPAEASPEILLIKRAEWERDPWSGHMAFPGGRREKGDASLLRTAVRETREETGVALLEEGETLGRLEPVTPQSSRLPDLSIVPFVFAVRPETPAWVASPEVAEVHWIPLERFRDRSARTVYRFAVGAEELAFPAFEVQGRLVWGLTHRILTDLLKRVP